MALSASYATAGEYRQAIKRQDAGDDPTIGEDLIAVSRLVEKQTGRFFNVDDTAVARVFVVPQTSSKLWIEDMAETPDSIMIDDDTDGVFENEITDYELLPLSAALGPEQEPYTRVNLPPWSTRQLFRCGQRVQITGKWGWPAVPATVKRAVIELTAILRLETPRATRQIPELDTAIEASPEAQSIVRRLTDAYKKQNYV